MKLKNLSFSLVPLLASQFAFGATSQFGDFSAALGAATNSKIFNEAEPLFVSLETYSMSCKDAKAAIDWLEGVRLDPANDGKMQVASRRAAYVAKALAHTTSPECHEMMANLLKRKSREKIFQDLAIYAKQLSSSREAMFRVSINGELYRAVIAACGNGKNERALETLRKIQGGGGSFAESAVAAIAHIGHMEDLNRFIAILKKDSRARLKIDEFGRPAIDRIMREVNDPSVTDAEKNGLIGAIAYAGGHESIPSYVALLEHPNRFVSRMAAQGIARIAEREDLPLLKSMLQSPSHETRASAIQALKSKNVWGPELGPIIIDALQNDPSWYVKSTAISTLAALQVCEGLPAIVEASRSRAPEVSGPANAAIKMMNDEYNDLPENPSGKLNAPELVREGETAPLPHKRFVAANTLAHAGYHDESFPILKDLVLNGKDRLLRYDSLYILWQMGDSRSKRVMEMVLNDQSLGDSAKGFLARWEKGCRGFKADGKGKTN